MFSLHTHTHISRTGWKESISALLKAQKRVVLISSLFLCSHWAGKLSHVKIFRNMIVRTSRGTLELMQQIKTNAHTPSREAFCCKVKAIQSYTFYHLGFVTGSPWRCLTPQCYPFQLMSNDLCVYIWRLKIEICVEKKTLWRIEPSKNFCIDELYYEYYGTLMLLKGSIIGIKKKKKKKCVIFMEFTVWGWSEEFE